MKNIFKQLTVMIFLIGLAGCSLGPLHMEPETTYMIDTLPQHVTTRKPQGINILVMLPETAPAYNTTQMAYTIKPYQVAYFGKNRFAETHAQMLHPLIVQTLQKTNFFHAVIMLPTMGRYQFILNTRILQLQQNFTHRPPAVELIVLAQLSQVETNQVIATQLFSIHEPIIYRTPYGGVLAANHATEKLLRELALFCLKKIQ